MNAIASSIHDPRIRRWARSASIAGALLAACMLTITVGGIVRRQSVQALSAAGTLRVEQPEAPGVPAGQLITTGGSATAFALLPPAGAACPGDTASGGYRIQSYLVPASVDPSTLTFDANGPAPAGVGTSLRQPLFSTAEQAPFVNKSTAAQSGLLIGFPASGFSFGVFADQGSTVMPAGNYNMGYACTPGPGAAPDRFWNVEIQVTTSAADAPGGFTWTPGGGATTTTTTTVAGATTTVAGATTTVAGATTTVAGATTTVAGASATGSVSPASPAPGGGYQVTFANCQSGETITFSQPESTPTSVTATCADASALTSGSVAGLLRPRQTASASATATFTAAPTVSGTYTVTMSGSISSQQTVTFVIAGTTSTTTAGGSPTGTTYPTAGTIPSTGSSTMALLVWGALLVIFGRMAILLGRKPKVLPSR